MKTQQKSLEEDRSTYKPEPTSHTAGIVLLLIILLLISRAVSAQSLTGTIVMEKTVMGIQSGVMVKKENANGYIAGVFYQKNIKNTSEISAYGYEYAGILLGKRLFGYDDINLSPFARIGMSDRSKFVLAPGIMMVANIKNRINLEVHASVRASQASATFGLSYQLNKRGY
jgi:hypothetical protein